jgi:hypothetical protein
MRNGRAIMTGISPRCPLPVNAIYHVPRTLSRIGQVFIGSSKGIQAKLYTFFKRNYTRY